MIEQLKNGVQATRLPVREFYANWTYLVIAALAWNIKAWAGLLLPEEMGARSSASYGVSPFPQRDRSAPGTDSEDRPTTRLPPPRDQSLGGDAA